MSAQTTAGATRLSRTADRGMPPAVIKIIAVVMLGALMMQLDMTMTTIATRTLVRDLSVRCWGGQGRGGRVVAAG